MYLSLYLSIYHILYLFIHPSTYLTIYLSSFIIIIITIIIIVVTIIIVYYWLLLVLRFYIDNLILPHKPYCTTPHCTESQRRARTTHWISSRTMWLEISWEVVDGYLQRPFRRPDPPWNGPNCPSISLPRYVFFLIILSFFGRFWLFWYVLYVCTYVRLLQ